jgi:hypothetical protein
MMFSIGERVGIRHFSRRTVGIRVDRAKVTVTGLPRYGVIYEIDDSSPLPYGVKMDGMPGIFWSTENSLEKLPSKTWDQETI